MPRKGIENGIATEASRLGQKFEHCYVGWLGGWFTVRLCNQGVPVLGELAKHYSKKEAQKDGTVIHQADIHGFQS